MEFFLSSQRRCIHQCQNLILARTVWIPSVSHQAFYLGRRRHIRHFGILTHIAHQAWAHRLEEDTPLSEAMIRCLNLDQQRTGQIHHQIVVNCCLALKCCQGSGLHTPYYLDFLSHQAVVAQYCQPQVVQMDCSDCVGDHSD